MVELLGPLTLDGENLLGVHLRIFGGESYTKERVREF